MEVVEVVVVTMVMFDSLYIVSMSLTSSWTGMCKEMRQAKNDSQSEICGLIFLLFFLRFSVQH